MTSYKAIAYSDTFEDGRQSGLLFFKDSALIFQNESYNISLPTSSLKVEIGGTANRQIFLLSEQSKVKFSTSDHLIFSENFFKESNTHQKRASEIKRANKISNLILASVLAVFLMILVSMYFFRKNIIDTIASKVPFTLEQKIGKAYIAQLGLTETLDSISEAHAILDEKIKLLFHSSEIPFTVFISSDTLINAYALPGGYVIFNIGLLSKANSWEEVLGVASHEIAHVTRHHHSRAIISQYGWSTLLSFLFGDGGALTDILFSTTASLEGLSYSRSFESEADLTGFDYMVNAGINPQGMVDFFKILDKEETINSKIPEFISTHPDTKNRIKAIQKMVDEKNNQKYKLIDHYEEFKTKLNSKIITDEYKN